MDGLFLAKSEFPRDHRTIRKTLAGFRRGAGVPERTNLTLPDEPLPLSDRVLKSLSKAARAKGKDSTARLVSDLLEKIASEDLYKAVLDEEAA